MTRRAARPTALTPLVPLLALVAACAIAEAGPPLDPAKVAGCYAIAREPWSAGWGKPAWSDSALHDFVPPDLFELDTAAAPRAGGWRRAHALSDAGDWRRGRSVNAGWRTGASDTLRVEWATTFAGTRLALRPDGRGGWRGEAQAFGEVARREPAPHAAVRATRIACPVR